MIKTRLLLFSAFLGPISKEKTAVNQVTLFLTIIIFGNGFMASLQMLEVFQAT